ncbi:uncharacterized protein N7446_011854 [Penicillium canescens]|uniref:uncharacterized protein n=1 Tax=Penicillium canescens TaxID=5083 RepID=UPI0026E0F54D|nr:uncharacterized protein N7446_011854 [Penicillium canescens]KAJ6047020.1 hypothetical protein N7446_011854 [Penicillium canescens]
METQALPALALVRGPGDKKLIPSSDGTTCRIEIDNVPYCSFCRKPYHVDSECFTKNPKLKQKDGDGPKPKPGRMHTGTRKQLKKRPSTDDEDDDAGGPKDPKKPTFMATRVSEKDVNEAFGNDIEGNFALSDHIPIMMAIKTLSIRDAWIVDSGCAQHVCNSASRFVQMAKYHGPSLTGVDTSTAPSGVGTVNILCNVRGRKKWLVLDNVLYVPSAHANLISVLQLLKRGAKVEFSSRSAIIRNKSNEKNLYTANEYHGVYALDLWTSLTFPSYHVSPQMSLWHNRLAHMSDANLRRLKKQAHGVRDMEPRHPCNSCLQGRMIEKPHRRSGNSRRGEHAMELLHIDVAGPFDEGLTAVVTGSPSLTISRAGSRLSLYHEDKSIWQASVPASGRQLSMAPSERALPKPRNDISHILPRSNDNSRVLTQPSNDNSQTPASSQSSNEDSQPAVAVQGDRTLSSIRSDDALGPLSPAYQDSVLGIDSPPGGDQQQDDAQQGLSSGEWQRYPELQLELDNPVHEVQQGALDHHPEMKIQNIIPTLLTVAAEETEPSEPKNLHQAKNDTSWLEWKIAMLEEVNSLKQNKTWELVDSPKDRRVLSGKWVFKLKRGPHGEVLRHKSRWVVRGFTQEDGIDYDETFASVVKPMSYKALFAIGAALDFEIEQMDVKTAFLYGHIDHEIYVEQPHHMTDGTPRVCKLRKALYGLKQAPRIWYQTLTNFLRSLGFEPITADLGIFVRSNMYIAVYVDDLLIVGPSIAEIKKIKRSLRNRFQMTDLGPCSYYLGISIQRDRQNRKLSLSQEAYIDKVAHQFDIGNCAPIGTPIETSPLPENSPDYTCPPDQRTSYQRMVGSLMYIMLGTRGDIAYAVSVASRSLANPGPQHIKLAQRILRYLKGTKSLRLAYKGQPQKLKGFTDADWGGCRDTRRSTAGYLFNIGSGAISWQSKRQGVVALSTCEAEFLGQTQATKEAVWLRRLLNELNMNQGLNATIICGDNQGAIALSSNPQYHSRTKHMEIQRKWQGEVQDNGTVKLKYIPTTEQIADGFTKPLARERFEWFRKGLGVE